jgi:hypothetical protein
MKTSCILIIVAALLKPGLARADAAEPSTLSEADQVWANIKTFGRPELRTSAISAPAKSNRASVAATSLMQADKLREFYTRYPDHPRTAEAKWREASALNRAALNGDWNNEQRRLNLVEEVRKDTTLADWRRFELVAWSQQVAISRRRLQDHSEYLRAQEETTRALISEFPAVIHGYNSLAALARDSAADRGQQIARDLLAMPGAPSLAKQEAERALGRFGLIGSSIDAIFARFGASNLTSERKDQVTVIYAWSSTELPALRAVRQLAEGTSNVRFIGLCSDSDTKKASDVAAELAPPGTQYYVRGDGDVTLIDGLYMNGVSTVYITDRQGIIRDVQGRHNFRTKIEALLK